VSRLFVEFLHFIAVDLDFSKHCVSVRKGELQPINRSSPPLNR
jgi:hypothetical protein